MAQIDTLEAELTSENLSEESLKRDCSDTIALLARKLCHYFECPWDHIRSVPLDEDERPRSYYCNLRSLCAEGKGWFGLRLLIDLRPVHNDPRLIYRSAQVVAKVRIHIRKLNGKYEVQVADRVFHLDLNDSGDFQAFAESLEKMINRQVAARNGNGRPKDVVI